LFFECLPVLVDTPVGIYFQVFLQEQEERAADNEVVKNLLSEVPLSVLENVSKYDFIG
jgi:hypothetical protein